MGPRPCALTIVIDKSHLVVAHHPGPVSTSRGTKRRASVVYILDRGQYSPTTAGARGSALHHLPGHVSLPRPRDRPRGRDVGLTSVSIRLLGLLILAVSTLRLCSRIRRYSSFVSSPSGSAVAAVAVAGRAVVVAAGREWGDSGRRTAAPSRQGRNGLEGAWSGDTVRSRSIMLGTDGCKI